MHPFGHRHHCWRRGAGGRAHRRVGTASGLGLRVYAHLLCPLVAALTATRPQVGTATNRVVHLFSNSTVETVEMQV